MSQPPELPVTSDKHTSNSTVYGNADDAESLWLYQPGGFHPVHIGDCFGKNGRYRVAHKLGFGGFGTVWMCYDETEQRLVALKIHAARVPAKQMKELHVAKLDKSARGARYISLPLDYFPYIGPNGTHQCLVFPLHGPQVSPSLWRDLPNPGPKLRKMCLQAAEAMSFLHKNGICHGDFRANNILVKLKNIDNLNEEDMLRILGRPEKVGVQLNAEETQSPSIPDYLVVPADLAKLNRESGVERFMDEISIIDFGEAFLLSHPPKFVGIPEEYLPPEGLVAPEESIVGIGYDLWALGCAMYEIKFQMPLFYFLQDRDEIIAEMVYFFGRLPDHLWQKWQGRQGYFKENGQRVPLSVVSGRDTEPVRFEDFFKKDLEVWDDNTYKRGYPISAKELILCRELLLKLFRYAPGRRLSAEKVTEDRWFKMEDP